MECKSRCCVTMPVFAVKVDGLDLDLRGVRMAARSPRGAGDRDATIGTEAADVHIEVTCIEPRSFHRMYLARLPSRAYEFVEAEPAFVGLLRPRVTARSVDRLRSKETDGRSCGRG